MKIKTECNKENLSKNGLTKFDLWKELEKKNTERQSRATGFFPTADLRTGALNEQKGSNKKQSNGPRDWRHENYDRQGNNERVKRHKTLEHVHEHGQLSSNSHEM